MIRTMEDIIGYAPYKEIEIGDYVFWTTNSSQTDEETGYDAYTRWANSYNPHPRYPIGYKVLEELGGGWFLIETHCSAKSLNHFVNNSFKKVIFKFGNYDDSLQKEIYNLKSIGYRKG